MEFMAKEAADGVCTCVARVWRRTRVETVATCQTCQAAMWRLGPGHRVKPFESMWERKTSQDRCEQCNSYQQTCHFSRADSRRAWNSNRFSSFSGCFTFLITHNPHPVNLTSSPSHKGSWPRPPQSSSQPKQPQGLTEALVTSPWLCNVPLKYLANLNMRTSSPQSCDWRFLAAACHPSTASEPNQLGRSGSYEWALIYTERPFKSSPANLSIFWKHFFRNKL